jgi:putative oxidoreductase
MSLLTLSFMDRYRDYGAVFIRLIVGFHLIYGTVDNIVSHERMLEFVAFLEQHGFPFTTFCAHLSVYAQFLSGLCFIVGAFTRYAGAVMVLNFIVAYGMVHWDLTYRDNFPPLMMLAAALFFFVYGAGRLSIDDYLERRSRRGRRMATARG